MVKIRIKDVEFSYNSVPTLKNVSLDIEKAEVVCIIGPNGAGKTTLLKCINKILEPQAGCILIDGKDLKDLSGIEIAKRIGYVSQTAQYTFPTTVFDVILMGRKPHFGWRVRKVDIEKVLEIVDIMGLEDLAMKGFDELSGGQRQKVLIARALAQDPEVLLLDEPTSNLDIKHQLEVMELIKKLVKERGISAVIAIHDLNLASMYADKVVVLHKGKIFAVGKPEEIITSEIIRNVYGVEVEIVLKHGKPFVVPIKPIL